MTLIHLPATVAGEFGIPCSEARRRIALGRVKINDRVVTDCDVDLADYGDDTVRIELESRPTQANLLAAQANLLVREDVMRRRMSESRGQRKDSLEDQLRDVREAANRLGCYDAADFIERKLVGLFLEGER